jgi:tetratricopeptide (TPR) repeat protein
MYRHYESSEDIFVDREEYIEWMNEALRRCNEKTVVLHLHGMGGIGKSSLLDYWTKTIGSTIRLDCEQHSEFYDRLNVLAKGAVFLGVKLERFDVLWQIRQRFVEGVEPVREEGREWAKEVVMAVPFIGSLASIGSAIKAVSTKVTPKLREKYGTLGKWLQEVLGKNHVERLLEILWKDPHHAEFLFLDALLGDFNSRKNVESPLVFLLDHFEYVDAESPHWRYSGRQLTETELWCVFLSSLSNCVGVMASRRGIAEQPEGSFEKSELTELDRESCIELLNLRDVTDAEIQERVISVSGGNPFVIGTFCDMAESSSLSLASIEGLRSDTLEEVRLKTWRKLFNEVKDLQELVNRAGLLQSFDRNIMNIIAPTINTDQWTRMIDLSFVRDRDDGTYVMHDLARDLVAAELGDRFGILAEEVAELLERAAEPEQDVKLLGLSISVQGLYSPDSAIKKVVHVTSDMSWKFQSHLALELLDSVSFGNLREQMIISTAKAFHLIVFGRVAEAEHLLKEAIDVLRELAEIDPKSNKVYLGQSFMTNGILLRTLGLPSDAEPMFEKALQIVREQGPTIEKKDPYLIAVYWFYSTLLNQTYQLNKAINLLREVLDLKSLENEPVLEVYEQAYVFQKLGYILLMAGGIDEAEAACRNALETQPEYATKWASINVLGYILRLTSRPRESEYMIRRNLDSARKIAEKAEGGYHNILFESLRYFGLTLRLVRDYIKAETYFKEALEISKKIASENPKAFLFDYTQVLSDFAVLYSEMGQYSKAAEYYEEALENYEQLSRNWPDLYEKFIAWTSNNYAIILGDTGEENRARKLYHRALDISNRLVQKFSENIFNSHLLGNVLNNLGVLHWKMKENEQAEEALREALEIRQTLAEKAPNVFLTSLATTFNNRGVLLATTNRLPEAQEVTLWGLEIRRELVKKSPEMHNGRLGFILNNLGNIYKLSEEHSKAEEHYLEALDILEDLAAKAPSVYQRHVTMILSNLLLHYRQKADSKRADSIRKRLEKLGSSDISEQEVWIEEEDAEADIL